MALKIYEEVNPSSAFSTEGDFDNPLTHSFNGTRGEIIERKYYLRNDANNRWYSGITIQPTDNGDNIVDGSGNTYGFSWKVIAGNSKPLEEQWALVSAGESISMSNIGSASVGDTYTYLPFWLRIEVPANAEVGSYQGVTLVIEATEGIVP